MRRIRLGEVENDELVSLDATIGTDENGDLYLDVENDQIDGRGADIYGLGSVSTEDAGISQTLNSGTGTQLSRSPVSIVDGEDGIVTAIALFPISDDHIVIAYRWGNSAGGNDGAIYLKRSQDGGLTWSDRELVYDDQYDPTNIGGGITSNGSLIVSFNIIDRDTDTWNEGGLIRSTDDGETWSSLKTVSDRGWAESPQPHGRLTELDDGTLLVPFKGYNDGRTDNEHWVVESTDDGQTWGYKSTISSGTADVYDESTVLSLGGGDVIAMGALRDGGSNYPGIIQFSSTDGGSTWSRDGIISQSPIQAGLAVCPMLYYDGDNDEVALLWGNRANQGISHGGVSDIITAGTSEDNGLLLFSTADASSVVGDSSVWDASVVALLGPEPGDRFKGYGKIDGSDSREFVGMTQTHDGASDTTPLIFTDLDSIRRMAANGTLLSRVTGERKYDIVSGRRFWLSNSTKTELEIVNDSSPPDSGTDPADTISVREYIPSRHAHVTCAIDITPDGTADDIASVNFRDVDNDAILNFVGAPSDGGMVRYQVTIPTRDGEIHYDTNGNVDSIRIFLEGFSV